MEHDYMTIEPSRYGDGFDLYGWGEYPETSVLAGQQRKQFIAAYATIELALADAPDASVIDHHIAAHNSVAHLPGEDDPVPGGMYPDDWEGDVYV